LNGAGQALAFGQGVAAGQHGTDQLRVVVGQEDVERGDGCQAAVDGARLQTAGDLLGDKAVDVAKGDGLGWPVADDGDELLEVAAKVAPGVGVGIASAHPVDKAIDLG
jgi:hypothetical protein